LGATVLSDVVPAAIAMLPRALLDRLQIVQQAREADIEAVRARYAELGVAAECAPYIADFPERLRWAHLVIARAGASTVAELACAGRPAIFVPYPHAMDDHQSYNVVDLVEAGGAQSFAQAEFTPGNIAKQLQRMALEPGAIEAAADNAAGCGLPNATRDLADLVESFAPPPLMDVIRVGASAQRSAASGFAATRREAE
jgi:UDP-N-acetylglucosamine--N-acetylmuramyl-(pentapeptide) pyrophosphoryl-undecaprenol N-acetylglucosamine transferase